MPRRRTRKGRGKRTRRSRSMSGRGFFDSLKSGLSKANDFLKRTKLVSKISGELANAGVPYADKIHSLSSRVGYGKRRRRRRARTHK